MTLLGYRGHRLREAADGAEALAQVRMERPDLVIADILMPTMDGYELVRQLRADSTMAPIPVIFYTAHYHEQEARALAQACGVAHILTKPSEPELVLRTVDEALGRSVPPPPAPAQDAFDREHLRLLTDKLSQQTTELRNANLQLTALIEISLQLAEERDPQRLLETFCHRARDLMGAKYGAVGILSDDAHTLRHFFISGMDAETAANIDTPTPGAGWLGTLLAERRATRRENASGDPTTVGFPPSHPPIHAVLGAPIVSPTQVYGWICLSDKLGAVAFSAADEQLIAILAAQVGRIYESGTLYRDVQHYAGELEQEVAERKRAEAQTQRQYRHLAALRMIDMAITASLDVRVTLNVVLDQVTSQLVVDAADILLLNAYTQMLDYAAGRGFRSHEAQHTHLRLGAGYAGSVALDRRSVSIPNLASAVDVGPPAPLIAAEGFVAYFGIPLLAKGQIKGVLELFHRAPLAPDQDWLEFLEALAGQAAIAIDNAALFDDLQHANVELTLAYDTTLEGWSRALDLRDKETEGHTQRVTEMTMRLARAIGMREAEMVQVRRGALLHDIGKMGIPDAILLKPGPLTADEWAIMRQHPVYAYQLLAPIAFLKPALDIPYCHHEKWDGSGYPRQLAGEQIPFAARLFAVVDVWDAMRSDRPYRKGRPAEQVHTHIRALAGTQFDSRAVEIFLSVAGNA